MSSENKRSVSSKTQSATATTSANTNLHLRKTASAKISFNFPASSKQDDLLSKEEEYKRLNAELERKTATLVYEAEQVLKANEKLLNETDYLNKIGEVNFIHNDYVEEKEINQRMIKNIEKREEEHEYEAEEEEFNLFNKLMKHQQQSQERRGSGDVESTIMPRVAHEMSGEAQIRFLKAKLKVLQEEVERLNGEVATRDEENVKLTLRCKELDEDRAKQLRISNSHQTQNEKLKKLNDEIQQKLNHSDAQMQSIKKENDQLKRDSKKYTQEQQQQELRLNRALEEVEKYKQQLQKTQTSSKDLNDQEKKKLEQLQMENRRLQKQKVELIQAFKKQLKLIDILKKQKLHLEAARMLQFTEEEFITALEWNSSSNQQLPPAPPKGGAAKKPATGFGSQRPSSSTKLNKTTKQDSNRSNDSRLNASRSMSDLRMSKGINKTNANNKKENLNPNQTSMINDDEGDGDDFYDYDLVNQNVNNKENNVDDDADDNYEQYDKYEMHDNSNENDFNSLNEED